MKRRDAALAVARRASLGRRSPAPAPTARRRRADVAGGGDGVASRREPASRRASMSCRIYNRRNALDVDRAATQRSPRRAAVGGACGARAGLQRRACDRVRRGGAVVQAGARSGLSQFPMGVTVLPLDADRPRSWVATSRGVLATGQVVMGQTSGRPARRAGRRHDRARRADDGRRARSRSASSPTDARSAAPRS